MTVDRNLRRKHLLTSFLNTFAKHGLDKTSMRSLIIESGISSSFIYEMFESRDQIVIDTIRFYYQSLIDELEVMHEDENMTFIEYIDNVEKLTTKNIMYDRFVTQSVLHPGYSHKVIDLVEKMVENQITLSIKFAQREGIKPEYAVTTINYLHSALNAYVIMMNEELFHTQVYRLRKFWQQLQKGKEPKPSWQM